MPRWSQALFVICFLIFGVALPLVWPSAELWQAILKLVVGTVVATGLWLGVVYLTLRRRS